MPKIEKFFYIAIPLLILGIPLHYSVFPLCLAMLLLRCVTSERTTVAAFLILVFRYGICDDSGTCLKLHFISFFHHRADRDTEIHVTAKINISGGTSVQAAALCLQLIDDLHRPDLSEGPAGADFGRGHLGPGQRDGGQAAGHL